MKDLLFKAANLNLADFPSLLPFFDSINFDQNKVTLKFKLKIQQLNKQTLTPETLEIPNKGISELNQKEGFLGGDFVNEMYVVSFDSPQMELLKKIHQYVDQITGEMVQPHSVGELEQKQAMIDTVESQIKQSLDQAKQWQQDLDNNKLPEMKRMRNNNEVFEGVFMEAKKAGLINA
jgi:hypothetical protein